MSEPFLGQIIMFAGNFAPRGWAFCSGQLLTISQNSALFSILGTTYGGDGRTTFALPDLRSRVPMHAGQGPGLPNINLGSGGGSFTTTLTVNNLPSHTHTATVAASSETATESEPAPGLVPAATPDASYVEAGFTDTNLGGATTSATGGQLPATTVSPYRSVNFIIALQGVFPSRS